MNLNGIKTGLLNAARKGTTFVEEKVAPSVSGFVENARETTQDKIIPGAKRAVTNLQENIEEAERRRRLEKEAYDLLSGMTSCNDCVDRNGECCPKWGEPARFNCYWWIGENVEESAEQEDGFYEIPIINKRRNLK